MAHCTPCAERKRKANAEKDKREARGEVIVPAVIVAGLAIIEAVERVTGKEQGRKAE